MASTGRMLGIVLQRHGWDSRLAVPRDRLGSTLGQLADAHIKERHKEDGQERGRQHASHDTGPDRLAA